jgi:ribonuclease PH
VVRVIVLVVQANKTVLGSAVNCAVLALLDAGVAMGDDDDRVLAGSRRGGGPIYSFIKE